MRASLIKPIAVWAQDPWSEILGCLVNISGNGDAELWSSTYRCCNQSFISSRPRIWHSGRSLDFYSLLPPLKLFFIAVFYSLVAPLYLTWIFGWSSIKLIPELDSSDRLFLKEATSWRTLLRSVSLFLIFEIVSILVPRVLRMCDLTQLESRITGA